MFSFFLGCVRLTVFRNRNIWNISKKSFVFMEIHIKIVKHLLKCYFKHIYHSCCSETCQTYRFNNHSTHSYSGIGSIERALNNLSFNMLIIVTIILIIIKQLFRYENLKTWLQRIWWGRFESINYELKPIIHKSSWN